MSPPDEFLLEVRRTESGTEAVGFWFRPTKSDIVSCKLDGREATKTLDDGFTFLFEVPASGPDTFTLRAESRGEPISLARVLWTSTAGPDFVLPPLVAPGGRSRRLSERLGVEPSQIASPEAVRALHGRQSEQNALAFFTDLDDHSGKSPPAGGFAPIFETLRRRLEARVRTLERAVGHSSAIDPHGRPAGGVVPPGSIPELRRLGLDASLVLALAEMQERTTLKWFNDKGTVDIPAVRTAFERFASGTLDDCDHVGSTNTWPSQPDSANLFFWAEFALLAMALEHPHARDPAFWRPMLRIFVHIQPIYVASYGRKGIGCQPATQLPNQRLRFWDYGPPRLGTDVLSKGTWVNDLWNAHADPALLPFMHAAHAWRAFPGGFG